MSLRSIQQAIIDVIDWVHNPFRAFIPAMTFRYALCGGVNLILDIILYYITYHFILNRAILYLDIVAISAHIAAFLIVFPITFSTGFLMAKYITFTQSNLSGITQLSRYALSVAGSILLNYLFLKFFVEYCMFYPTPSKMLTTFLVIIYSYIAQKHYTFQMAKVSQKSL